MEVAPIPSRRGDGTLVFKPLFIPNKWKIICFYGPSLGGKTTALDWVYKKVMLSFR